MNTVFKRHTLLFALCTLTYTALAHSQPLAPQSQRIVLEATGHNAGSVDRTTLRRMVAWKEGQLILSENSACQVSLQVKRVISGQLPDDYVNRPFGLHNLRVLALSPLPSVMKAPSGLDNQSFVSQWTWYWS